MKKEPKVSIIIPTYNREKYIKEAIESAINQTYQDYEIIIVDNNSTDNTYNIIESYAKNNSKIRSYKNKENVGPVKNWKKCIELSKGEYIKIIWSDDYIEKNFLEVTVPILENNQDVGFVYSKTIIFSEKNKEEVYEFNKNSGKYKIKDYIEGKALGLKRVPVSPGCALFRKKDVEKNFLIEIPNIEERDFSQYGAGTDLLLFLLTYNDYEYFYYFNEILSYFRVHEDSITKANNLDYYYNSTIYYFFEIESKGGLEKIKNEFYSKIFIQDKKILNGKKFQFQFSFILKKILSKIKFGEK